MPNPTPRSLTARSLRKRRTDAGLDQTALASKAACAQSTISQLETGKRGGTVELLKSIADALGCTIDDLISDAA